MFHKFSIKTTSLFVSLAVVAAFGAVSPIKQAEAGDNKVDCGTVKDEAVKEFCKQVDGKAATIKNVMKKAQNKWNDEPVNKGKDKIKCQTCHETANGGALTSAAKDLWPSFKPKFQLAVGEFKK